MPDGDPGDIAVVTGRIHSYPTHALTKGYSITLARSSCPGMRLRSRKQQVADTDERTELLYLIDSRLVDSRRPSYVKNLMLDTHQKL